MHSFNRVLFLSLGGVCLLIIPFFWAALAYDYKALENVMISLSESYFVGYPIPELLGSSPVDSIMSQVFRIKILFSLCLFAYSLLFISLSTVGTLANRTKFLFRALAIPLFIVVVAFWLKFIGDDHIINKEEKSELFLSTTICLVLSIFLYAYSFRSKKKNYTNPNHPASRTTKPLSEKSRSADLDDIDKIKEQKKQPVEGDTIAETDNPSVESEEIDQNDSSNTELVGSEPINILPEEGGIKTQSPEGELNVGEGSGNPVIGIDPISSDEKTETLEADIDEMQTIEEDVTAETDNPSVESEEIIQTDSSNTELVGSESTNILSENGVIEAQSSGEEQNVGKDPVAIPSDEKTEASEIKEQISKKN